MDAHSFSSRVEVLSVTDSGRRRRWTVEEKIRIVEESFSRPRAVSATAPAASAVETKIEIVLGNGRRVVAPVSIDPAALARLLPVLDRA